MAQTNPEQLHLPPAQRAQLVLVLIPLLLRPLQHRKRLQLARLVLRAVSLAARDVAQVEQQGEPAVQRGVQVELVVLLAVAAGAEDEQFVHLGEEQRLALLA